MTMRLAAHPAWCVGLLGMACLGLATPSWAEGCEGSASTCATAADAVPPAAPPDMRALLEAHSRSRKALATQHATKPRPPTLKQIPPRIEPGRRPDVLPHTRTKRWRTPTRSPYAPPLDHVECDVEGFATKSGRALSDHIRAMTYRCFDALFYDAPLRLRLDAFQMQDMIDVAQATIGIMETYEGANTDHLYSKHYLFLRIGYYNYYTHANAMDWGAEPNFTVVTEAVVEAVDAFVENGHFLDHTDTHGETAWEIFAMLEGRPFREYLAGYLPAFKSWINAVGRAHVELGEVVNSTNRILTILWNGHNSRSFVDAATNDPDFVATLRSLALKDYMLGTHYAEVLLGNAGNVLAGFLRYESAPIYPDVVAAVRAILDRYDGTGDEVGVWLETAKEVSRRGKCADFQICGFEQELEARVLSISHACSAVDVRIRAQDLTDADLAVACGSLAEVEDRFHELLNTGRQPVADDHNAHLEIIVYADWDNYDTYSGLFFGNDTDNGGIYFEGNPANPNNVARFFVYVADWLPERRIWNLEHEYVHYLDGRFNIYGGFSLAYDALWWAEGLAEYVTKQNDNEAAIELASSADFLLDELFSTTYDHSVDRVYRWGYLAVRFMFERHPEHVGRIAGYLRAGCFVEHDRYLERGIGSAHNAEWRDWLGTVRVTSDFTADRGIVAPPLADCRVLAVASLRRPLPSVDLYPIRNTHGFNVAPFFDGLSATGVTYTVSSSNPDVVGASLDGSLLTLVALAAGNAEVMIVASDGDATVSATFRVAVTADCPAWICRSWNRGWRLAIDGPGG